MSRTVQQILTVASSPTDVAVALASLQELSITAPAEPGFGFGEMLREAFAPAFKVRTGLAASATHVEDRPGVIVAVLDEAAAAQKVIVYIGAPIAGQVKITYADGVPTLLFGDGANTGYQVLKIEAPADLTTKLAALFR